MVLIKNKYAHFAIYGVSSIFQAWVQKWTQPDAPSATAVLAATLLTTAVQAVSTGITNPDFPRLVSVTGNDGNVTGDVVVTGVDIRGNAITDTIASNGTNTVDGIKAFAAISSIQLPVYAVAGTETISVGISDKLGLEMIPAYAVAISAHHNATLEGTLPTITRHATDISQNVIDFNSACNADHDQAVLFYTAERPKKMVRTV